jgi:hypothetical protein
MRQSKTLNSFVIVTALVATAAIISSCSTDPMNSTGPQAKADLARAGMSASMSPMAVGGPPGYEMAYVSDTTVRINAIEVKQNPTDKAQADFYEVVYPFDPATGQELTDFWPSTPQCSPCDHQGDGITPDDFHDHVLDSRPSDPGHGEYNALWRVFVIMPNYTGSVEHNSAVNSTLESLLPAKSEDAVNDLLSTQVEGVPLVNEINTHFYFICAVVGDNAGSHQ